MYEIIKTVIQSKQYELTDMIKKIDTQWISGKITDEQRAQLIVLAQENASVSNSIDVINKLSDLDKRLSEIERTIEILRAGDETEGDSVLESTPEEYIPGKYYYNGDEVIFEGSVYICTAPEGVVCVWSPTEYPAYWTLK